MSNRRSIRNAAINYLNKFSTKGNEIRTKLNNINGKATQYDVPDELYLQRLSRKSRVLMPWKEVKRNHLTIEQLNTISGGVVVEFVNLDFFSGEIGEFKVLYETLKSKLGSDDNVSSMISIRSEGGNPSSQAQRAAYDELIKIYPNYESYLIRRKNGVYPPKTLSIGNEKWEGFIYISIRGGQQDTLITHHSRQQLFNPAVEFASEEVCIDIDLVLAYFALFSIPQDKRNLEFASIQTMLEEELQNRIYDNVSLLSYTQNHPSLKLIEGVLTDPIQMRSISINDFSTADKSEEALDFSHNEAVNKGIFYFDEHHQVILSPTRPNNIFWSKHLSNMMQQNYTLDEYFELEKIRVKMRRELLGITE